jgi:DNA-binding MarR family transcriptional regulator
MSSRLLRSLERQGLVQAEAGPKDDRVRRVTLTREGMTEVVELGRRSDAFATSVLAPLSAVQRARLVTAMGAEPVPGNILQGFDAGIRPRPKGA